MRIIIVCVLFLFSVNAKGADWLKIGLFKASKISQIDIYLSNFETELLLSDGISFSGQSSEIPYRIIAENDIISVYYNSIKLGSSKEVRVICHGNQTVFFKPSKPDYPGNNYTGQLIFNANAGLINSINELPMNTYLNGVIRGEIGFDKDPVVYEVHAIMSRTYAYRFIDKHKSEGYNLCDQTHCQVFKGYFDYEQFDNSIDITNDLVLFDHKEIQLAEGLFHANCGGNTSASEDVWSAKLDYCRPVVDTFCVNGKHANWEVSMDKEEFIRRMRLNNNSVSCDSICYYNNLRSEYIIINGIKTKSTHLRQKLNLKSAFFNFECDSGVVKIYGKGFGHGVGLCQEGAIRMAELCYTSKQILNFYYKGAIIKNYFQEPAN